MREKLEYMHANPVKRELAEHPKDWPWSSWSHYENGEEGLIAIDSAIEEEKEWIKSKSAPLIPKGAGFGGLCADITKLSVRTVGSSFSSRPGPPNILLSRHNDQPDANSQRESNWPGRPLNEAPEPKSPPLATREQNVRIVAVVLSGLFASSRFVLSS